MYSRTVVSVLAEDVLLLNSSDGGSFRIDYLLFYVVVVLVTGLFWISESCSYLSRWLGISKIVVVLLVTIDEGILLFSKVVSILWVPISLRYITVIVSSELKFFGEGSKITSSTNWRLPVNNDSFSFYCSLLSTVVVPIYALYVVLLSVWYRLNTKYQFDCINGSTFESFRGTAEVLLTGDSPWGVKWSTVDDVRYNNALSSHTVFLFKMYFLTTDVTINSRLIPSLSLSTFSMIRLEFSMWVWLFSRYV